MNVTCGACGTTYRVDPAKVPPAGVRARCVCDAVFWVRLPREAEAAAPVFAGVAAPAAASASPPPLAATTPASTSGPASMPVAAPVTVPDGLPTFPSVAATLPTMIHAVPAVAEPAPPVAEAAPPAPAPVPPVVPITAPMPTRPPAVTGRPGARPANPFLSQDPAVKARRLARALVSDMVAYNPVKRADGLRDGTLKQLFEDEIRKSWEEFSDQVGRDVAESTPYFREALNEILSDGRPLF